MILNKDILGVRPDFQQVKAELENPPVNSVGYQETPDWGSDLLTYGEPWGGPQTNQTGNGADGKLEQDTPITYQGDNPEMDADFYTSVGKAASEQVGVSEPWGDQESRQKDQQGGNNQDAYSVLPQGFGADPASAEGYPVVTGFPNGFEGAWDSPLGEGTVRSAGDRMTEIEKLASIVQDRLSGGSLDHDMVESTYAKLAASAGSVGNVARLAAESGIDAKADCIRIASLDQLFAFKAAGKDKLIHKATNDLWKIALDESGNPVISREFDASGASIKA